MRDLITSGVRTAVQVAVTGVVAWFGSFGIGIDSVALETALFAVATGLVTMGLNWLTTKVPAVGAVLSLGLTKTSPTY